MIPLRPRIRKSDMEKIIEEWNTLKAIGVVCEHTLDDGSKIMLIKLWGDMYITPDSQKIYRCKPIIPGKCKCKYDDYFTEIWRRLQSGEIRLI